MSKWAKRDTHWSYAPRPDVDGVYSIEIGEKTKVKLTVMKVEKIKMPPINKTNHDSKKRKPATVTRPRSQSPLGEDPQITVTEVEFESPVKIVAGDPEYVHSIESLAEKARKAASAHDTSPTMHVIPVLKVSVPIEDEAAMAADVLCSTQNQRKSRGTCQYQHLEIKKTLTIE